MSSRNIYKWTNYSKWNAEDHKSNQNVIDESSRTDIIASLAEPVEITKKDLSTCERQRKRKHQEHMREWCIKNPYSLKKRSDWNREYMREYDNTEERRHYAREYYQKRQQLVRDRILGKTPEGSQQIDKEQVSMEKIPDGSEPPRQKEPVSDTHKLNPCSNCVSQERFDSEIDALSKRNNTLVAVINETRIGLNNSFLIINQCLEKIRELEVKLMNPLNESNTGLLSPPVKSFSPKIL